MSKPKILILGAGYAGLLTARNLQKKLNKEEAEITLINKNDYHYQATWLHETAAGTVTEEQTIVKISEVIDVNKVNVVIDTVTELKPELKKVITEKGEHSYDYLVIGLGYEAETFGIEGLNEHAFKITTIDTCRELRSHVEEKFARFSETKNPEDLTIIVGGAGFTGVEYLAELGHKLPQLCDRYHIDKKLVKIICVEAMNQVLPGFDPKLVKATEEKLKKMGVELYLSTRVKKATPEGIVVEKDGEEFELKAGTMVWAAGVRGNSIVANSSFENNRGRVMVNEFFNPKGYEDVFIVGDCSLVMNEESGRPLPPTAQLAIQQAYPLADNLVKILRKNKDLKPFKFEYKGTVCSIGHDDGVGEVFGVKVKDMRAAFMKKIIDNRWLFLVGGAGLVLKKGKFKFW